MRITKLGHEYIRDFSEKAAQAFVTYGFYYGGALGVPEYFPKTKELIEKITADVSEFDRNRSHFTTSGRVLVTGWDSAPWFRLWFDLREPIQKARINVDEKTQGEKGEG